MYRYDEFDAQIVKERVDQFRGQVERRLSGEILEDEFKPLRLQKRRLLATARLYDPCGHPVWPVERSTHA